MPYAPAKKRSMPLMCSHGHAWETLVVGIDWNGAIYQDAFCPKCGRIGSRLTFTPADLGNMVNDDDIALIGPEAMPIFASALMAICEQHEKTQEWEASFLLDELGEFICESRPRIVGFLNQLREKKFLDWDEKYDKELRRVVKLGPKVRLVQLITE